MKKILFLIPEVLLHFLQSFVYVVVAFTFVYICMVVNGEDYRVWIAKETGGYGMYFLLSLIFLIFLHNGIKIMALKKEKTDEIRKLQERIIELEWSMKNIKKE